jgi:hypothetical protein
LFFRKELQKINSWIFLFSTKMSCNILNSTYVLGGGEDLLGDLGGHRDAGLADQGSK